MRLSIYVDGSGGQDSGFGYVVRETGESSYMRMPHITNNQAEYMAIISALERFEGTENITIHSDSQNTVKQLNHEYAINSPELRKLAMRAWPLMARTPGLQIVWVRRADNIAGKMLGS